MIKYRLLALIFLSLFLTACSPSIYSKTAPETTLENEDDLMAAGYFARYLMSQDERAELVAHIYEEKLPDYGLSVEMSTGIGVAGTMALGQNPLSRQGVSTGSSIQLGLLAGGAVLNMLGPDGSLEGVSKIYLPETWNGQTLNESEQAFSAARKYTVERIREAAELEGRRAECILNCENGGSPAFRLIKQGMTGDEEYDHTRTDTAENEYYDPPAFYVITALGKMVPAEPDPFRDAILGFTPRWESEFPNAWQIYLAGDVTRAENGEIETVDNPDFGAIVKSWRYSGYKNPLFRRVLSHLTGGPGFITWGRRVALNKQFCMQGRVFTYIIDDFGYFMKHEIAPESYRF